MTDDARVPQQPLQRSGGESGDFRRLEVFERPAVALALPQDREPAQSGLSAFQAKKLEEMTLVARRDAPLRIVIGEEKRVTSRPFELPQRDPYEYRDR